MEITIKVKAVSWKNRTVKVLDEWAQVASNINLKQLRIDKEHTVEIETNLEGKRVITKIKHVK